MSGPNRALAQRWFHEVWNERRPEVAADLMSPEVVAHTESGEMAGLEPFLKVREQFLAAFPDLTFQVEAMLDAGDDVVVRWAATGTHAGDALGIEPCHRKVAVRGMTWQRYRDGRMVEAWDTWNQGALLQHLSEISDADRNSRTRRRLELAERVRQVRLELYGESGAPDLARRLGVSLRSWYNYESGVTIPAEILLHFIEETDASPAWLNSGEGARYGRDRTTQAAGPPPA